MLDYEEINNLMKKCVIERNDSNAINEEFRQALIKAEEALRELKRFY